MAGRDPREVWLLTMAKPGDRRYTVETLRSGQPRPYADTIREFVLTIEWIPYRNPPTAEWEPNDLAERLVMDAARTLGHGFKTPEEGPKWYEPRLREREKLGPGKWRFLIVEEYTD